MRVQLALDFMGMEDAVDLVRRAVDLVDIVEVGTPVILRDGVGAVRRLHAEFPDLRILADLKIADGGAFEAGLGFDAGASIVTVLATAADRTVQDAVRAAGDRGGEVMVDLIGVPARQLARRAAQVEALGARWVCVHTAVDLQAEGAPVVGKALAGLRSVRRVLRRAGTAVAGGISPDNAAALAAEAPGIVVTGSGVTRAADPVAALARLRRALGLGSGGEA
jgi:3-hexulose-6-phosphate synthase